MSEQQQPQQEQEQQQQEKQLNGKVPEKDPEKPLFDLQNYCDNLNIYGANNDNNDVEELLQHYPDAAVLSGSFDGPLDATFHHLLSDAVWSSPIGQTAKVPLFRNSNVKNLRPLFKIEEDHYERNLITDTNPYFQQRSSDFSIGNDFDVDDDGTLEAEEMFEQSLNDAIWTSCIIQPPTNSAAAGFGNGNCRRDTRLNADIFGTFLLRHQDNPAAAALNWGNNNNNFAVTTSATVIQHYSNEAIWSPTPIVGMSGDGAVAATYGNHNNTIRNEFNSTNAFGPARLNNRVSNNAVAETRLLQPNQENVLINGGGNDVSPSDTAMERYKNAAIWSSLPIPTPMPMPTQMPTPMSTSMLMPRSMSSMMANVDDRFGQNNVVVGNGNLINGPEGGGTGIVGGNNNNNAVYLNANLTLPRSLNYYERTPQFFGLFPHSIMAANPSAATTESRMMANDGGRRLDLFNNRRREPADRIYSCKVFVGGLPQMIEESEIVASFQHFGPLEVDWPHKADGAGGDEYYSLPKGYAFLLFLDETSVQCLIDHCDQDQDDQDDDKLYYRVSSSTVIDKPVQIRPWKLTDANFSLDASIPLDSKKTVFVGGVPRQLKAFELATLMDGLYGCVCYAEIDIDPLLKYPKGAARVVFSSADSFQLAITTKFVQLQHAEIDKMVEVKPFVLDDRVCDQCNGLWSGGKFAPFFCADSNCLRYYCDRCWSQIHSCYEHKNHKPFIVKEGASRSYTLQQPKYHR